MGRTTKTRSGSVILPPWEKGDVISAARLNKMQAAIASSGGGHATQHNDFIIQPHQLDQDLFYSTNDDDINVMSTVLYFDQSSAQPEHWGITELERPISAGLSPRNVMLKDERHWMVFYPANSRYFPIMPTFFHIGKTLQAISANGVGDVEIWRRTGDQSASYAAVSPQIKVKAGCFMLTSPKTIAIGKKVIIFQLNHCDGYEVFAAEC